MHNVARDKSKSKFGKVSNGKRIVTCDITWVEHVDGRCHSDSCKHCMQHWHMPW